MDETEPRFDFAAKIAEKPPRFQPIEPKMNHEANGAASDDAAWEVFWRLRAALGYVHGAEAIARQHRERWPVMAGELEQASRLLAVNQGTAELNLPRRRRGRRPE